MLKHIFIYLLIGSFYLLSGCLTLNQSTPVSQPKKINGLPAWTQKLPNNPSYFMVVVNVSKTTYPTNYDKIVRQKALAKLNSELVHKIHPKSLASNFFSNRSKQSYSLKEEDFEGLFLGTHYETEKEYWGLYQIRKDIHQNNQKEQHGFALEEAKSWFTKAQHAEKRGYVYLALIYYLESLWKVERFIHLPNKIRYYDKDLLVDFESRNRFQKLINQISIQVPKDTTLTSSSFAVRTIYENKPISKIPVITISPNEQEQVSFSDQQGIIPQNYSSDGKYEWNVHIEALLQDFSTKSPMYKIVNSIEIPLYEQYLGYEVRKISIQKTPEKLHTILFEEFYPHHLRADIKPHRLQCIIEVKENFEDDGSGFMLCRLNTKFVVQDGDQVIFQENLDPVLGIHAQKEGAKQKAFDALPEILQNKTIPNFIKTQHK